MEIIFAMNNLEELGIQKVIATILNNWDEKLASASLSIHNKNGRFAEHLNTHVPIFELDKDYAPRGKPRFLYRTIGYYRLLKKIKPKTVIAVNQGEALSLALVKRFYKNFRLIVCEHSNITESIDDYKGFFGWYYRKFFRHEYLKYANVIHTVSYESKDDMVNNWNLPKEKIKVIYNPVMIEENEIPKKVKNEKFIITLASRLEKQKRLDILLKGMQIVKSKISAAEYKNIEINIMGDGSLRDDLEKMSKSFGLNDIINFKGFVRDPWKEVAKSDLFISTSEWEGLSVSLIEAQKVNTPIFASDCPSGNKEILLYGKAGVLFEKNNIQDFADKFIRILENKEDLIVYSREAKNAFNRFDLFEIMKEYSRI